MIAKLSDFGISRAHHEEDTHISTRPAGTAGYMDPEYVLRRQLTTGSDVYGYGVVVLELITGQLAIDHQRHEDYSLIGWVRSRLAIKGINSITDPRLGEVYPLHAYEELARLAVSCTAFDKDARPTMQFVVNKLEKLLSGLVPPPEHMAPLSSPGTPPLLRVQKSNAEFSAPSVEEITKQSLRDVETDQGFDQSTVEPR
ncbi:hypothetical protein KP509_1Z031200 [Ceratopteris richardii]|nr:hypothetical protein KP509_1Z031200 [Ceratopteris richardii]